MTKQHTLHKRGFTLIELLVVTAIIVVISGVVLANNNKFGGKVALDNLAYDIALTLRQVQGRGISTARSTNLRFNTGFGMHFVTNASAYTTYDDSNGDGAYSTDETIPPSPYNIRQGYKVGLLCVIENNGNKVCGYSTVDVWFSRPEPDACIGVNGEESSIRNGDKVSCAPGSQGRRACIEVLSPRGDNMYVVVEASGQIAVQSAACGT